MFRRVCAHVCNYADYNLKNEYYLKENKYTGIQFLRNYINVVFWAQIFANFGQICKIRGTL